MQIIIYIVVIYFIGAKWRFLVKTGNQSYMVCMCDGISSILTDLFVALYQYDNNNL